MFYETVKRLIDIFLSLAISLFFLPLCLLTAIAIKLDSKGPIFADIPCRVGKGGKPFKLYKFRSMIVNAHQLIRTDPKLKELYEEYKRNNYKLTEDPRWTRVGKFIRKYSIDEIPSMINVLKGEMSLVGPRPYYFDEIEEQQKTFPRTKDLVKIVLTQKPGVTGDWQVSGRSEINFDKRIEMDAAYVNRHSTAHDLAIILKTPWAMISGKGAV